MFKILFATLNKNGFILCIIMCLFAVSKFPTHMIGQLNDTWTWQLPRHHTNAISFTADAKIGGILSLLGLLLFSQNLLAERKKKNGMKNVEKKYMAFMFQFNFDGNYLDLPITCRQCDKISSFFLLSKSMRSSFPSSVN